MIKNKIKAFKTIEIPHLKFIVYVKDMSELRGVEVKGSGMTCLLEDKNSACIFLQDVKMLVKNPFFFPYVAHEVMHIIQILCKEFNMDIKNEHEHTAYLMNYLLEEILEYSKDPNNISVKQRH